jgi:hypothetical protein
LSALGIRIVRYRALGGRPVQPIIAALAGDPRIRRAQINAGYQRVPAPTAPEVVTGLQDGPPATAKTGRKQQATALHRPTQPGKALKAAALHKDKSLSTQELLQVGNVGDVLSGGL